MQAKNRQVRMKKIGMRIVWTLFRLIFIGGVCFVILYPLFTKIMSGLMDVSDVYVLSPNALFRGFCRGVFEKKIKKIKKEDCRNDSPPKIT